MVKPLVRAMLLLVAMFLAGTIGYRLVEGAGWWNSFYMTVITLTTVGYEEVFPLSRAGQIFTVALLLTGLGILLLFVTELGRWAVQGELQGFFRGARRSRMMESLTGHEIVCGWGRMGQSVVAELRRQGRTLVVIEGNPDKVRRLRDQGVLVIEGDSTSETVLKAAGVERARGLVTCLNDDAHNVYAVLTARSLNSGLVIVARATDEGAEERMRRAGADRVVNPYHLGGIRLAHLLVKPAVMDFLDLSLGPVEEEMQIEQLRLATGAGLAGSTIGGADLRRKWGIAVVAVQRGSQLHATPDPDFQLEAGDVLVVLGSRAHLAAFEASVR